MTAADFTPVTPEAAAAALDAALFDGAPADERLLDAWATIVAMGEQITAVKSLYALRVQMYDSLHADWRTAENRAETAERSGAVKALRDVAAYYHSSQRAYIDHRADAIENGADL